MSFLKSFWMQLHTIKPLLFHDDLIFLSLKSYSKNNFLCFKKNHITVLFFQIHLEEDLWNAHILIFHISKNKEEKKTPG